MDGIKSVFTGKGWYFWAIFAVLAVLVGWPVAKLLASIDLGPVWVGMLLAGAGSVVGAIGQGLKNRYDK